jgi:hypothetical protein
MYIYLGLKYSIYVERYNFYVGYFLREGLVIGWYDFLNKIKNKWYKKIITIIWHTYTFNNKISPTIPINKKFHNIEPQ